jgi:hypothetical protein
VHAPPTALPLSASSPLTPKSHRCCPCLPAAVPLCYCAAAAAAVPLSNKSLAAWPWQADALHPVSNQIWNLTSSPAPGLPAATAPLALCCRAFIRCSHKPPSCRAITWAWHATLTAQIW